MNRAQRREEARKKAEFVNRMAVGKLVKQQERLNERLVVKGQFVRMPDARALALVAKWKERRA